MKVSKYGFELMEVGETKPFPENVKLSSLRVMLSVKGEDHGMKFSVNKNTKEIKRVK